MNKLQLCLHGLEAAKVKSPLTSPIAPLTPLHSIRKRATTKKIADAERFSAQQPPLAHHERLATAHTICFHLLLQQSSYRLHSFDEISFRHSPSASSVPPVSLPVPSTAFASPPELCALCHSTITRWLSHVSQSLRRPYTIAQIRAARWHTRRCK